MADTDTRHRLTDLLKQLGVAAVYALLIHIEHSHFESDVVIGSFEPASGLALAVLLIFGKRYAGCIFLGALLTNTMQAPFMEAAAISSGDTLQALCGAWLLTRNARLNRALHSLNDYLRLISLGGALSVGIGALIATTALLVSGFVTPETYFRELLDWWMSDMLGVILITPLILVCWQAKNDWRGLKRKAEAALLLGLTFLVGQIIFLGWFHDSIGQVAKSYVMFLFVTWVAVRLGTIGTVIAINMAAIQGLLGAQLGAGYFANDIAQTQLVNYWLYTLALSVVGMALATYVSWQRQSKEVLRQSELKFRTLFESTNDAVMLINEKGFLDCNKATLEMIGCATKEEFCSKHPADLSPPEQPCGTSSFVLANQHIAAAMKEGSRRFEWVSKRVDSGRVFIADVLLSALELQGNLVLQVVIRDITEQKHAIEEFERFFNLIPDMACIASIDGYFKKINRAWQTTLGYTEQEILAAPFLDFIHPDDISATMKEVERQLAGGKPSRFSNRYRCKDGSYKLLEWDMIPPIDGNLLYGSARDVTEQRRAEEELKRFFDLVPDLVCIASTDGHFLKINRAWQTALGYTEQEILATPFLDFIHPDDRDATMQEVERQITGEATVHFSNRYRCKDGSYKWLEWDATPAVDKTLLFASARDITERRHNEELLRKNKERLRAYLDNISDTIWVIDANLGIDYVSSGVVRLLGFLPEDLIGKPSASVIHPDDMDAIHNAMHHVMEHPGEPKTVQYRVKHKDGHWIAVESTGINLLYNPAINGVLVAMRDITERRLAEKALRESEERLLSIMNNTSAVIFMKDTTGRYLFVNSRFEKLFHLSNAAIQGKTDHDIFPQDMADAFVEADRKAIYAKQPIEVEERVIQDDGIHTYISIKFPLRNASGETYAVCGIATDITERKAAEQRLHELSTHILDVREEEKSRIAREIHDELGGTLTALKIDTHWLLRKLPAHDETMALIERIKSISQRIDNAVSATRHIIDNMRPTILDDLGLLAAIEWQAAEFCKNTGIECQVSCIEDEGNLDNQCSIALFRILQEALTNISRHSGASRVEITFFHNENEVALTVCDNGRGMRENHAAVSKSYGILGMTERIKQLGGKIIFSNPPDGGFCIEVFLPLPTGNEGEKT